MKPSRVAGEDKLPEISDRAVHVPAILSRRGTRLEPARVGALAYGRGTGTDAAANQRTTASWTRWPAIDILANHKTRIIEKGLVRLLRALKTLKPLTFNWRPRSG